MLYTHVIYCTINAFDVIIAVDITPWDSKIHSHTFTYT